MTPKHSDPLHNLQREVERLFHDLVYQRHPASHFGEPHWSPPCDLLVSDREARVIVELPGVPREAVKVTLHGRVLEVTGRRAAPVEPQGAHYHRAEIFFGEFRRTIELPWEADAGRVEALYRDGMLVIHLVPVPAPEHTDVSVEGSSSG